MDATFETKDAARDWVWEKLDEREAARFPYPIAGRIPNFEGAEAAADRLLDAEPVADAERLKVNPDSPQKHLRRRALEAGKMLFVPTPRLRGGFMKFDPAAIPEEHYRDASMISRWEAWAESVPLDALPQMDAIVTGCVAVTEAGARCGKGEGYSDLEYGILRELGHAPVPVATTVHELQVVDDVPVESHDLRLRTIATPKRTVTVDGPTSGPEGIDWSLLDDSDLDEMPVLERLREMD